jgi:adenosylhomocysteine nucleosidase
LKKVGIICAGDREVAPFIPMIRDCAVSEKAMLTFYSGVIENVSVVTLFSGVCRTNAAVATQILIDTYGCGIIINAGTAGGMDNKIKLFDTVVSTESAYWDVAEEILTEFHPWAETIFWQADKKLIDTAKKACFANHPGNIFFGRMITGEAFIEDQYRSEVMKKFSPLSVDMETAGVAHVCYINKIPYIAVRTITDTADHKGINAFDENCDKASQISADIVRAMLSEIFSEE